MTATSSMIAAGEKDTPATLKYANKFYEIIESQSIERELSKDDFSNFEFLGQYPDLHIGDKIKLWSGKLSNIYIQIGASGNYYSRIRRILVKYDCISILQRGTSAYPSVLVLNHPPPSVENILPEDLTAGGGDATLPAVAERLTGLEQTVTGLENWRTGMGGLDIVEVLRDFERRLQSMERAYRREKREAEK